MIQAAVKVIKCLHNLLFKVVYQLAEFFVVAFEALLEQGIPCECRRVGDASLLVALCEVAVSEDCRDDAVGLFVLKVEGV